MTHKLIVSFAALLLVVAASCKPSKKQQPQPTGGGSASMSHGSGSATSAGSATASHNSGAATSKAAGSAAGSATQASGELGIAELKFSVGAKVMFSMAKDGTVTKGAGGKVLGKLTSDGKLTRDGKVVAQLRSDGTITYGGNLLPARLDRNNALVTGGGKTLAFESDGSLRGGNPRAPKMRIDGLTSATKRTAMYLVAMMFIPASSKTTTAAPADGAKRSKNNNSKSDNKK